VEIHVRESFEYTPFEPARRHFRRPIDDTNVKEARIKRALSVVTVLSSGNRLTLPALQVIEIILRPDGGIGRHTGLKIKKLSGSAIINEH